MQTKFDYDFNDFNVNCCHERDEKTTKRMKKNGEKELLLLRSLPFMTRSPLNIFFSVNRCCVCSSQIVAIVIVTVIVIEFRSMYVDNVYVHLLFVSYWSVLEKGKVEQKMEPRVHKICGNGLFFFHIDYAISPPYRQGLLLKIGCKGTTVKTFAKH